MLESIITYAKKSYSWSDQYVRAVVEEYERFLHIRSLDSQTSPSDPIDQFWHVHILYTEDYYNYCMKKFNKFIHHNPDMSLDQKARQQTIAKTLKLYSQIYPSVLNPKIWNINTELVKMELGNCVDESNIIRVKVIYTFDYGKRSEDSVYNNQVLSISVSPNMTYQDIINFISKKTSHHSVAIKCYPTNETFSSVYRRKDDGTRFQVSSYDKINMKLSKYYIFELEEMTSKGYC